MRVVHRLFELVRRHKRKSLNVASATPRAFLRPRVSVLLLVLMIFGVVFCPSARAGLIYLYDFPGSPGSGLATDQTNGQPTGATISDFTRNGGLTGTGVQGIFGSKNWPTGSSIDPTVFTAFSITAGPNYLLNLSQLTFDSLKNGAGGPTNAEVALFLNGSSTAYATFDWTPANAPLTSYIFSFTPITDADSVTTATFKFFAWNANDATNEVQFDNMATYGAIVPEPEAFTPILVVVGCAIATSKFRAAGKLNSSTLKTD